KNMATINNVVSFFIEEPLYNYDTITKSSIFLFTSYIFKKNSNFLQVNLLKLLLYNKLSV
ncbi:MAG: hypothetical protein D6830_05390, partial [Ignavibacteria bacterium]